MQIAAFTPLMYMCICTYYSLFKMGMMMFYSLTPKQTSSVSLLMICSTKLLKYDTDQRKLERLASLEVMMPSLKDFDYFKFWLCTLSNRRPVYKLHLLCIRHNTSEVLGFLNMLLNNLMYLTVYFTC